MLLPPVLLLFLFIAPSFAAPLPAEGLNNIAIGGPQSNELVSRKIHVHLPKVHLPHVDDGKILDGLKKFAPKIGKTIFKIATKLILREERVEARSLSDEVDLDLTKRDIIGDDLIARSPKKGLKKLLKAVKKVKKYVKKTAKKYAKAELKAAADTTLDIADDSLGERDESPSYDRDIHEGDWEYDVVVKELEGLDVDVRELELYLDALVGRLEHLMRTTEDGNDWEIQGHWLEVERYMTENGVWH